MDKPFDSVNQLIALLGDRPSHPWGALIPQVLLWCFRRFCIEKLTDPSEVALSEQVWDDHLDLIRQHAPKGLESASSSWLTPENIEHVHSSLEEYNRFFLELLVNIDVAVTDSDSELENSISGFLDADIKRVIKDWLGDELKEFLIFPIEDENDDEFTDEQFTRLLDSLMKFDKTVVITEPEAELEVKEPEPEPKPEPEAKEAEPEPEPKPEPKAQENYAPYPEGYKPFIPAHLLSYVGISPLYEGSPPPPSFMQIPFPDPIPLQDSIHPTEPLSAKNYNGHVESARAAALTVKESFALRRKTRRAKAAKEGCGKTRRIRAAL
jgi:hypothetical protein